MNKHGYLAAIFAFLFSVNAMSADITGREDSSAEMQRQLGGFLDQLSQQSVGESPEVLGAMAEVKYGFTEPEEGYYREASQDKSSPYRKSKTLETLYKLAEIAAASVGTSRADEEAESLRDRAVVLRQSGVPEFAQAAGYYEQEAKTIDEGGYAQARDYARRISNIPRADITDYTPSDDERKFSSRLGSVAARHLQDVMGVAGDVAVRTLLTAIGGPVGAVAGQILGPVLGAVFRDLLGGGEGDEWEQAMEQSVDTSAGEYSSEFRYRMEEWARSQAEKKREQEEKRRNQDKPINADKPEHAGEHVDRKSIEEMRRDGSKAAPGGALPGSKR